MFGVPERKLRDCRDSSYFLRFAKNKTSQGGEDGIFSKLFELIGTTDKPYCVDIGAWDGKHLSNTYQLINDFKWGGLLVEANSERYATLCALYADRSDVTCIDCLVDIEGDSSLNTILQKQCVPFDLDFVSIDVDGADYHLWHTIGETYKPRVMCIEFNPTIPNHVHFVQERDIAIQEGSSLLALVELGRSFGYHVVVTTTFNAIFVRHDLLHRLPPNIFTYLPVANTHKLPENELFAPPMSVEHSITRVVDLNSLHSCSMATDIFQTYSGELKLSGPKKLMWHRVSMNIQQMQAIKPKKDRVFPFAPPYTKAINGLETSMRNVVSLLRDIAHQQPVAAQFKQELTNLLNQCTDVYGITGDSQSTATLKSICKEIWLNAVCFIAIALRDAVAVTHPTELTKEVRIAKFEFVAASAGYFELIGDQYVELSNAGKGGANGSLAVLEEGKQWYQRALQLTVMLATVYALQVCETGDFPSIVSKLSLKLSACAVHSVAAPAWIQSLREPGPSTSHSSARDSVKTSIVVSSGVVQSSVEDIDEILKGLFWRELSGPVDASGAATNSEESEQAQKQDKKWRNRLLWASSDMIVRAIKDEGDLNRLDSISADLTLSYWHFALGVAIGGAVGYFVAKFTK